MYNNDWYFITLKEERGARYNNNWYFITLKEEQGTTMTGISFLLKLLFR